MVATYRGTDPDNDVLTWSLGGADADTMRLDASGRLRFREPPPDFESPGDANGDTVYEVEVSLSDGRPDATADTTVTVRVTVTGVNEAPEITSGPPAPSFAENGAGVVATYAATDPEGNPITWTLGGADADTMEIDASGRLRFRAPPPDFESPGDANDDTVFEVTVTAGDGSLSSPPFPVRVSVTNVDEPGTVTLPSSPQEGLAFTATLTDPDGNVSARHEEGDSDDADRDGWVFERRLGNGTWQPIPSPGGASGAVSTLPGLKSYTPTAADVGHLLRARVSYRDGHGPGKRAQSAPTGAVTAAPPPPPTEGLLPGPEGGLAVSGWAQARVSWPPVSASPAVSGYDVHWQSKPVSGGTWPESWTSLLDNGAGTVEGARRAHVHPTLDPDRVYRYRVRARRGQEAGAWSGPLPGEAGVQPQPGPATGVTATRGDRQVRLAWTGPDHAHLTGWQYRSGTVVGPDTTWASWQTMSGSGASTRVHTVPNLTNGRRYTFRVRALNAAGQGAPSEATTAVTPAGVAAAPGNLRAAPGDGDRQMRLSWETAADNGSALRGYQYRQSTDGGASWAPWGAVSGSDATTTSHALTGLSPGAYTFEVRALNGVGDGVASNRATGIWFEENGTGAAVSYPSVAGRTWTRSGVDAGAFTLSSSGVLGFGTAPNFESPVDADTDNVYRVTVEARESGAPVLRLPVTVTVTNVDEEGTVTLSPMAPRVGQDLTATLSDPDGGEENVRWTWFSSTPAPPGGASGAVDEQLGTSKTIRPSRVLIGKQLRARANYTDAHGPGKQAASAESDPVVGVPEAPGDFEATPGNGQVSLRWSAPSSTGGSEITGYEHRHRRSSASWPDEDTWTGVGTATSATVPDLRNGTPYAFQVRAVNEVGEGPAADATATPRQPNRRPVLSGPDSPSFDENGTGAVGAYSALDPDGHSIAWSLVGDDASDFRLSGSGPGRGLRFATAPNFESPGDDGTDNVYQVTVKVKDTGTPADSSLLDVTVTVTNVDEEGTVTLSPMAPRVGQDLTATLSDPDGGEENVRWTWFSSTPAPPGGASGAVDEQLGTSKTIRLGRGLIGKQLRARARYDDAHGPGKQAASVKSDPVVGVPEAPGDFQATPGNGQVSLSWSAPSSTGGSAISRYEHRHRRNSASWPDEDTWTGVGTATSATVPDLRNGTSYTFEVRAKNGVGYGSAASRSATPAGEPDPPDFSATRGNGQVSLSWSAASANGSAIERYQTRYSSTSGHTWSGWSTVSGGSSASSRTVTGLSNGTSYTFEMRAKNGVGYGSAASASATPAGEPDPPDFSATRGNGQVSLSWSAASANGSAIERYQTRYSSTSGHTWSGWSTVSGGSSASSRTVTGLSNGTSYTFEMRAKNGVGYGSAASASATPAGAPGTPGSFSASSGNGQVSLSWNAASSNGSAIERYQTRYSNTGGYSWSSWSTVSGGSSASSATVTGLSNGTSYTFEVRAKNGVGYGSSASASATPAGAPGTPGSFSASSGNGQVSLSWNAASSNGSAIERYQTRYSNTGGYSWSSWSTVSGGSSASSATVTGLSNGTSYTFEVRAKNGVGYGSSASASATPAGAPGTPGSFSASSGNGQVSLSWNAASSNGSAIERYQTRYSNTGGYSWSSWSTVSGGSSASSATVTGLSNGTSYTFEVRAKNGVGYGSSASASATPAGAPGTPGSFSASSGNGQVSLSWNAASSNGSAIERYQTRYSNTGGYSWSSWSTVSGGSSASSATVTGLSNGTSYTFEVRAKNGVGYGSSASASATPAGNPGTPGSFSASSGNGQVSLSWNAASSNGSAIERYQTRYSNTGGYSWSSWSTVSGGSSASSRTVTGLSNGTAYTFEVRAKNGIGYGSAASRSATPAGAPGTPGSFSASSGNGQVSLSWNAASSNGSAIERYQTRYSNTGGYSWSSWSTVSGGSSASSRTVTGLSNGTSYTFEVRAKNGVGYGSAASRSATPAGAPGTPGSFSASSGNGQVSLSWNAASSNGSAIERYQTRYSNTGGYSWSSWSTVSGGSSASSRTVTGLSNGTSYTFEVRAKNGVGYGSAASRSATPAGAPGTPGSFSASSGNGQVSLSWNAASSNGSAIERYQTRYSNTGGYSWSSWSTVSGGSSASSRTVTSLSNGTSYTFEVRAKNGVGYGSAASRSATPAEAPDPPTGVSVRTTGLQSLEVTWTPPDDNGGSDLTGYHVRYCKTNEVSFCNSYQIWSSQSVSGGTTTRTGLTGLTANTQYTVQVRARNAAGNSGWSSSATGHTRAGARSNGGTFTAGVEPNPFNPSTAIRFELPAPAEVSLVVYNLYGQVVTTLLLPSFREAGTHTVFWDGRDDQGRSQGTGVYLYRLVAADRALVGKMTLIR